MAKGLYPKRIINNCLKCEKEIFTTEKKMLKGEGKYCSKICYDLAQVNRILVNCSQCNNELLIKPSLSNNKSGTHFCNEECYKEHKRNLEDNRPINNCNLCQKEYRVPLHAQNTSKFCSRKCQAGWTTLHKSGENSPVFIERVLIKCDWCQEECKKSKYVIEIVNSKNKFCSKECKNQHHINVVIQDPIFKEARRLDMIKMLHDGTINKTETKPQIKINKLLNKMKIKFENEYGITYYSIDNFLIDSNLFIEVMGGYWHGDNRFFETIGHESQVKRIRTDKSKNTYINNTLKMKVLYLWEYDINENIELCKLLIEDFILNEGILTNYHSFNYHLVKSKIIDKTDLIIPYMEYTSDNLNLIIDLEVKERMSKIDPNDYTIFNCDYCNTESSQLTIHFNRSEKHYCNKSCMGKMYNYGVRFPHDYSECGKEVMATKPVHGQLVSGERKNIFCNMECKGLWQSKNAIGINNKNFTSVEKSCNFCELLYIVPLSRVEKSKFCSPKCRQSAGRERFIVNCSNCNSPKEVVKSKLNKENHFCNVECSKIFRLEKNKDSRICEICNENFTCKLSDKKRFCTIKCQSKWQSIELVGVKANNYKGNKK